MLCVRVQLLAGSKAVVSGGHVQPIPALVPIKLFIFFAFPRQLKFPKKRGDFQ